MHVERGIGRAGYLLLALSTLVIGIMGLAILWIAMAEPTAAVPVLGMFMIAVALLVLFFFPFVLARPAVRPKADPVADAGWEEVPEVEESEFAFTDVSVPGPKPAAPRPPAPRKAPVTATLPPAFSTPARDPRAWPADRSPKPVPGAAPYVEENPRRANLAKKYTQTTPTVGAILTDGTTATMTAPTVVAEIVNATELEGGLPDGMVKGRCGHCHTALLAPTARPINLRCPSCQTTKLLD